MHIAFIIMEKPLKVIIIVLAITAVGLGYLISQRMISVPETVSQPPPIVSRSSTPIPPSLGVPTPSVTSPNSTSVPTPSGISVTPTFTQDEALILKPPPPAGSKNEDIGRYYKTVDKLAKNSDTVQLGSQCYANPLVVSIKYGSKLKVTNNDIYDHIVNFDGATTYAIASKKNRDHHH